MKQRIADVSKAQGFKKSRLPELTWEEVKYIRGTYDFVGINYYTGFGYANDDKTLLHAGDEPSFNGDRAVLEDYKPEWEKTGIPWLRVSKVETKDSGVRKSWRVYMTLPR